LAFFIFVHARSPTLRPATPVLREMPRCTEHRANRTRFGFERQQLSTETALTPLRHVRAYAFLPRDTMQTRPMPSCGVCLSACPSVTFVHSVETNKHIFQLFSPSDSYIILVFFQTKRHANFPTGTPPLTGESNTVGVGTNCDSGRICSWLSIDSCSVRSTVAGRRCSVLQL